MNPDPLKYYYNDTLLYNEKYDNTIYHIVDSLLIPRYYINYGIANMPTNYEVENKPGMTIYEEILKNEWAYIANVNETKNHLHVLYKYNNESVDVFYDKRNKKLLSFDGLAINNINLYNCDIVGSTKQSFFGVIDPMQLVNDNPDQSIVQSLELNENSNPVIFKIKLD